MLSVPASVTSALAGPDFSMTLMVRLPGSGSDYRLTDHWRNLTYQSATWVANGKVILSTDRAARSREISADSYQLTLDNADKGIYEDYAQNGHVGKRAYVYIGFVDPDTGLLLAADSVMQVYEGLVDSWKINDTSSSSQFSLRMTSHWSAFEVVNSRFTNPASQEEVYPGDTIFEYSYQDKLPIKWGL